MQKLYMTVASNARRRDGVTKSWMKVEMAPEPASEKPIWDGLEGVG